MRLQLCSIFFGLILPFIALGQTKNTFVETTNARRSLQIAEHFISIGALEKAELQLLHTIKIKDNFAVAYRELGKLLLHRDALEKAIENLEKSFDLDRKLSRAAYFECGEAYFKMGEISKAKEYYQKYQDLKNSSYVNEKKESALELEYDQILAVRQKNLKYVNSLKPREDLSRNLGDSFNSEEDDYLPSISNDGKTVLFTRRNRLTKEENIYINKKGPGNNWQIAYPAGSAINTNQNEGMAKFVTHSRSLFYAACNLPDSKGGCDIYKADFKTGNVKNIETLQGHINSEHWDSQPSVSCDGKTMYFSSIRPGGFGGADLYFSQLLPHGEWSPPLNMGAQINTKGDEEAPFIAMDGKTLFFTSDGHEGQGEGDIFMSRIAEGKWSTPANLGPEINSTSKELGFFVDASNKNAYFASARYGGKGGLDIYQIELPWEFRPLPMTQVEGFVIDAETKKPLKTVVKIATQGNANELVTDYEGWFFLCVQGNQAYSFQVEAPGYRPFIEATYIDDSIEESPAKIMIELQPETTYQPQMVRTKLEEQRIQFFFDFDSFELSEESKTKLNQIVEQILMDSRWKVEVVGFADKVGNAEYNKILSEKRAEVIVNFLKNSGIDTEQVIRREGKGSIQTTEKSGKNDEFNRRVDVVLRK